MRTALVQLTSTRDVDDNLETCRRLAERAATSGAQWILFPENAPFLGRDDEKTAVAETVDGPMVDHFAAMAREFDCWITVGSFPEQSPDPDRTYNTQVHLEPGGEVAAVYRKIHLFDVCIDDRVDFCESDSVYPGETIVDTAVVDDDAQTRSVGLSICYDLRFPELYRRLQARGVDAITVPAAFTRSTGSVHWHALLKARAIENQAYLLAPNQWGHHFGERHSYGQSAIYDPWGRCIACASDRPGVVVADLDFGYVDEIRQSMPVLSHRSIVRVDEPSD